MNKKENNIVYVFVDTQNLNKSFKKLGFDLDYTEFIFFEYEKARKIVEFSNWMSQFSNSNYR